MSMKEVAFLEGRLLSSQSD